jgi:cytosine deaminase
MWARRAIEYGYQGRVTAGHVCALDSAEPDVAKGQLIISEAGVSVGSHLICTVWVGKTAQCSCGLTRVKQLLEAGVNVTFASNNIRDALRPMGNFDLLEEGLVPGLWCSHGFRHTSWKTLMQMCTENAAKALRLRRLWFGCGRILLTWSYWMQFHLQQR